MIGDLGRMQTANLGRFSVTYSGRFRAPEGDIRGWIKTPYKPVQGPKIVNSLFYMGLRSK